MDEPIDVWTIYLPGYKNWTFYLPGYPNWWEFLLLLMVVATIMALGQVVKRNWTENNDSVPIPVALGIWVGSLFLYFAALGTIYNQYTDDIQKTTILVWGVIFWTPAVAYTSWTVVNSLAHRTIDRIGPFSALIEEPSEFCEARKLALRGDIDGAVRCYRAYVDNQPMAMFEAGRLLKSQDRFAEAALLFEEVAEYYGEDTVSWAEAVYQLAKVQMAGLHQSEAAQENYRRLLERAPSTRFGQLAGQELARLQVLGNGFSADKTEPTVEKPDDPFFDNDDVRVVETKPRRKIRDRVNASSDPLDQPVPPADPFFLAREAFRAKEAAEEKGKSMGTAKKKTVTKPKAPTKTKAAAKAKAPAKKPAAGKTKAAATPRKSKSKDRG